MARKTTDNRFSNAGQALVGSNKTTEKKHPEVLEKKKDKVISAKVFPDTWETFTEINRAQGMTNNSVINMLISEYVRNKKEILS